MQIGRGSALGSEVSRGDSDKHEHSIAPTLTTPLVKIVADGTTWRNFVAILSVWWSRDIARSLIAVAGRSRDR